jgi:hypothetical protein
MTRVARLAGVGWFAVACKADYDVSPDSDTGIRTGNDGFTYQIDVFPDAATGLLAQSFFAATDAATGLELALERPVTVTGAVTGYVLTPVESAVRGAEIPGQVVPISSDVSLTLEGTVQGRYALTSSDGIFSLTAVPGTYELAVVPTIPGVPFRVESFDLIDDVVVDVALDAGVPIYGQVFGERGQPLADVSVLAENTTGVVTAPVQTDDNGWYHLRVEPGTYVVVAAGRPGGRDPTLRAEAGFVDDPGLPLDFEYVDLGLKPVSGRVVSAGAPLSGARVRFTSESLAAYPEGATHTVEALTNASGAFDTRLLRGAWTLTVLPMAQDPASPMTLTHLDVDDEVDLGDVAVAPLWPLAGNVVDPDGLPVERASIRCTEVATVPSDARTWTTTTDALGAFSVDVSQTELACVVTPPGDRAELAAERVEIDAPAAGPARIPLTEGVMVSGRVRLAGQRAEPVPFALVQILDSKGTLWGSALTDGNGAFSARVAWPGPSEE